MQAKVIAVGMNPVLEVEGQVQELDKEEDQLPHQCLTEGHIYKSWKSR